MSIFAAPGPEPRTGTAKPGKPSRELLDAILAVLPSEGGIPPRAVHDGIGGWSRVSVRHALRELCLTGFASYSGPDCNRRYFRIRDR